VGDPIMHKSDLLRWIGNILLIIGYQTMLWGDLKYGLMIKVIGGLLTIPFAIKLKLWDVLFLCAFFGFSEISKLMQLFLVS
jgi:hypothetical protein